MSNYQAKSIGPLSKLSQYTFAPEGMPISIPGKVFLNDLVGLTSIEVSMNQLEPGTGMEFFHRHNNHEETYIFLSGNGEMSLDDEIVPVGEGSIVCVQPEAKRSWWNTGNSKLTYLVIQAPVGGMKAGTIEDGALIEGQVPWVQSKAS